MSIEDESSKSDKGVIQLPYSKFRHDPFEKFGKRLDAVCHPQCRSEKQSKESREETVKIEDEITKFRKKEFPNEDIASTFKKLLEEVGELGEAIMREADGHGTWEQQMSEAGDVAFLLADLISMISNGKFTMAKALEATLVKNQRRALERSKQ